MPGRSSKPLFELMTGRRSAGAAPAPRPDATKAPTPRPVAPSVAPASSSPGVEEHATYSIRVTTIYLAGAILLTLSVLIYAGGYKLGYGAGKADFADSMGTGGSDNAGPILDPIRNTGSDLLSDTTTSLNSSGAPGSLGPRPGGTPSTGSSTGEVLPDPLPEAVPAGSSILDHGSGPIMTYAGMAQGDPRIAGVNYVQLGDLPRDQAARAIEYLAASGERTIGVPLERRGGQTNNPWFRLFSLETPVPSEQFAAMGRDRRDHIMRVVKIGQRWQREERGGSDFRSAFYSKYSP